ncbi:MAG: EAL domain-containing protein [Alphaproteobacteria bacterium]|nr:EAL domain-containing protein [Alphaproteobacteria bacterium]
MADAEAQRQFAPPEKTNPTTWDRARLGVVLPLCIVVAVAIVCIVVAALTSAHRADVVALERERQLLTRAIVNHGEWALRRLTAAIESTTAVAAGDIDRNPSVMQQRIASWLNPLTDHDLIAVVNAEDTIVYSHTPPRTAFSGLGSPSEVKTIVGYLRGQATELPERTMRLVGGDLPSIAGDVRGAVLLRTVGRSLTLVTVMPMIRRTGEPGASVRSRPPLVLTMRIIEQSILTDIGKRLQLENLRMLGDRPAEANDHVHEFVDGRNQPIARLAWEPQRPGAQILETVFPFIGIALAGFVLLTGLMQRYMRHTAAAIAAGERTLRFLALHDPLCGLPNRNYFGERLESVIADVKRGGSPAALFYIDLDHFKDVNDTLGHPVGDELIRAVTLRLSRSTQSGDLVARLGGDEFAVITSASSDHAELQTIARGIITALCEPFTINGHTIVIGASIGIAVIDRRSGSDAADIMRYADMALYRAKNEGRNRACIYDAMMDADLSQRKLVEQDLREAIERDELKVAYQPIVNASGEKIVGVEALARWPHPLRGLIPPTEFIPIAEHSGLIIQLGAHVLRRACLDARAWPGIAVSVNVSPLQFRQIDFVNGVERILAETGLEPARLELELTESTLLGNVENAEAAMRRLRALGVQLALDDFGTGYSSLLYLRRFPFNRLKIDRSFVLSIEKAADAAAIVHAVVSLGRGLGMKVTAEGVETAEQHLFLRAAGVHCMQGYRFGAPTEPHHITERLAMPVVYRSIESDAKAALAG